MAKPLRYLLLKRDLNFKGLKEDQKLYLHQHYNVILKIPRGKYRKQLTEFDKIKQTRKSIDIELYDYLEEYCRKTERKDRQLLFYGLLLEFSIKEYYMLCSLLMLGEIDEQDFNAIDFRPKSCKKPNRKHERNIEKSLADLKTSIREKIKKHCETKITYFNPSINHQFCMSIFTQAFAELAYIDKTGIARNIRTKYKKADKPDFLR